jgi:hypothetical protein
MAAFPTAGMLSRKSLSQVQDLKLPLPEGEEVEGRGVRGGAGTAPVCWIIPTLTRPRKGEGQSPYLLEETYPGGPSREETIKKAGPPNFQAARLSRSAERSAAFRPRLTAGLALTGFSIIYNLIKNVKKKNR